MKKLKDYLKIDEQTAYNKVRTGEWSFDQFSAWVVAMENDAFQDGYDQCAVSNNSYQDIE